MGIYYSHYEVNRENIMNENHNPKVITKDEWLEIAELTDVRAMWGAENDKDFFLEYHVPGIYGAKFDFRSGGPGYWGDFYILMGDALSGTPVVLIRENNTLSICDDWS